MRFGQSGRGNAPSFASYLRGQGGRMETLFEACSAFTRVAACTLALPPYFVATITRRLQPCRYLHNRSGCYWLEPWPGGTYTHRKAPPFHGAQREPTFESNSEFLPRSQDRSLAPLVQFGHSRVSETRKQSFNRGRRFSWLKGSCAAVADIGLPKMLTPDPTFTPID